MACSDEANFDDFVEQEKKTCGIDNCGCIQSNGITPNDFGLISYTDSQCVEHELRADYGTGHCDAWDEGLDPFCAGENPPAFCSMPWCYVSEECNAPDIEKS